jgi:HEAT repeat protein
MFDRKVWRSQIDDHMNGFARDPWQDVQLIGGNSLLTYLVVRTLEPFLDTFEHEPIAAVRTLSDITDGHGANYIVRHARRMRFQSARLFDRDLHAKADFRAAVESLVIALETIALVRQRLNSDRAVWFRNKLLNELMVYDSSEFTRLRQMLEDPSWRPLHDIIRGLRQRHGDYTPADMILLREGLNDSTPRVRAESSRRIGEFIGMPAEQLVGKLLDVALYDCDAEPRNAAACAFGKLRDRITSKQLLDELAIKLTDTDKFVRSSTARVIEELGELACNAMVVEKLVTIVADDNEDAYAREAAACALGHLGSGAATADVIRALTQVSQTAEAVSVHDATLTALIKLRKGNRSSKSVRSTPSSGSEGHDTLLDDHNHNEDHLGDAADEAIDESSRDAAYPARVRSPLIKMPSYMRPGTDSLQTAAH